MKIRSSGIAFAITSFMATTASADGVHHFDLSAGHGCAANDCDTVWCWGGEEFIFGGTSGVDYKGPPEYPYQVGAGDRHSCVNMRDVKGPLLFNARGVIDCWGRNDFGQIDVPQEYDWRQLAVGFNHNCATNWSNDVICWGNNAHGQSTPPPGEKFSSISAHQVQSCGVSRRSGGGDGEWASCWGKPAGGVTRVDASELDYPGERFETISAGFAHTCAITNFGGLYCWGDNGGGQLGTPGASVSTLEDGTAIHRMPGGYTFIDVAAGEAATCAAYLDNVTGEHDVLCWGYPFTDKQALWTLGHPSLVSHRLPTEDGFEPVAVDLTFNEVCAASADGELRCWAVTYSSNYWSCDPAMDPNCCDDIGAPCCEPQVEPLCCDPLFDANCVDVRSWDMILEVNPYVCL